MQPHFKLCVIKWMLKSSLIYDTMQSPASPEKRNQFEVIQRSQAHPAYELCPPPCIPAPLCSFLHGSVRLTADVQSRCSGLDVVVSLVFDCVTTFVVVLGFVVLLYVGLWIAVEPVFLPTVSKRYWLGWLRVEMVTLGWVLFDGVVVRRACHVWELSLTSFSSFSFFFRQITNLSSNSEWWSFWSCKSVESATWSISLFCLTWSGHSVFSNLYRIRSWLL